MMPFNVRGLERKLGQPVIVDDRPGQGTAAGGTNVARAAPDGCTSSTLALNPTIYPLPASMPNVLVVFFLNINQNA
jgi:tripartite-type tricarboxylate transporter receptor subunit TctC